MANTSLITSAGKAIQANLVSGLGGTAPNYIGIGSGTTAPAIGDTALTTEYTTGTWAGYARAHPTPTRTTTTVTNDTISWVATFTAPAAETVGEVGNFDALTVGGLFQHTVLSPTQGLNTNDSVQFTITVQYT